MSFDVICHVLTLHTVPKPHHLEHEVELETRENTRCDGCEDVFSSSIRGEEWEPEEKAKIVEDHNSVHRLIEMRSYSNHDYKHEDE